MTRPVIGIIANQSMLNDTYPIFGTGRASMEAVVEVTGGVPLSVPTLDGGADVAELLDICDGFVLPGGRPNVHPNEYGHEATDAHGEFDAERDKLCLPLIREAVSRSVPILGICRGFQEFNVAFGGTLHPEIRELPGRMNHRMPPDGTLEEKFALRHTIRLTPGGVFAQIFGADEVKVNSLHGQGIDAPGKRVKIEGWAPDGTPEALRIENAPGFALAVQWHPEHNAAADPVSRPLFEAFGAALKQKGLRAVG
ncbi:MAG: gamma-glutamyl-gamma-aminobutyrate hydrolase family protein [Pseudomonadota bacterium]